MVKKKRNYVEAGHQRTVCQWLDAIQALYCHVPNEEPNELRRMIASGLGVKKGVADILIFSRPRLGWSPHLGYEPRGVALEMKAPGEKATPEQEEWLAMAKAEDWETNVCDSCDKATAWLQSLGFGR